MKNTLKSLLLGAALVGLAGCSQPKLVEGQPDTLAIVSQATVFVGDKRQLREHVDYFVDENHDGFVDLYVSGPVGDRFSKMPDAGSQDTLYYFTKEELESFKARHGSVTNPQIRVMDESLENWANGIYQSNWRYRQMPPRKSR